MISQLTQNLVQAIVQNGARSVFFGAIVEQLVGVLIPSPIIPMSAGFLLVAKELSPLAAVVLIVRRIAFSYATGVVIGASLFYLAAFFGGRVLVEKFGKFFGLSLKEIDKFRLRFTRGFKDEILLFLLLILPVTSISLVATSCGLIGIRRLEFYPILFAGVFFRSIFLAYLGWKTGETLTLVAQGLDRLETLLSLVTVGLAFFLLAFLYYRRRKYFQN